MKQQRKQVCVSFYAVLVGRITNTHFSNLPLSNIFHWLSLIFPTAAKARVEAAKAKAEEQKKALAEAAKEKQKRQAEQEKALAAAAAEAEAIAIAAVSTHQDLSSLYSMSTFANISSFGRQEKLQRKRLHKLHKDVNLMNKQPNLLVKLLNLQNKSLLLEKVMNKQLLL